MIPLASIDDLHRPGLGSAARAGSDLVIKRAAMCAFIAAMEGVAAAALVFGTALAYHALFLGISLPEFDIALYSVFGLLSGGLYGLFSAAACARFLDGERRPDSTLPDGLYGWTAATALTLLAAFLLGNIGDLSRVSLTAAYVLGVPPILALRSYFQSVMADRISKGTLHFHRVAVIGRRADVANFLFHGDLGRNGHKLSGALYLEDIGGEDGHPSRGAIIDFARQSMRAGADHMVFVGGMSDFEAMAELIAELKRFALNVVYAPAAMNRALKFVDVVPIGPNNAVRFLRKPMSDTAVVMKRCLDIVGAGFGLLVLAPLLLLVSLAIVIDSRGPVIYRQARRGFNGETFSILKFRTMSVMESGYDMHQVTAGDARITRVGAFLRQTSIDELPQLVNVLLGQMSLVGPRPHAISHDEELGRQMANYAHRQRIKPGITGWAQVNGYRGETSTTEKIEGRVLHDIHYIDNWSIFFDVWILLLTVLSPSARKNAH